MLTTDPRVAVNGAWPSISTRTSPSTTANHSRVSGCSRFATFVPGAAATYSPVNRPSSTTTSCQLASPLCFALRSASLIHGFCPGGYAGVVAGFGAQSGVGTDADPAERGRESFRLSALPKRLPTPRRRRRARERCARRVSAWPDSTASGALAAQRDARRLELL